MTLFIEIISKANKKLESLRLLPLVIGICALNLVMKVGGMWFSFSSGENWVGVSEVKASDGGTGSVKSSSSPEKHSEKNMPTDPQPLPGLQKKSDFALVDPKTTSAEDYKLLQEMDKATLKLSGSPVAQNENAGKVSPSPHPEPGQENIQLADSSSKGSQVHDNAEDVKAAKAAALEVVERRINEKISKMDHDQQAMKSYLEQMKEQNKAQLSRLVKMTETMEAKKAAKILEGVEFITLLELMEQIKEAKGSAILQHMAPEKASFLISELAKRGKVIGGGDKASKRPKAPLNP